MAFLGGPALTDKRSLGANLGADLGSALQGLAHHKTQQMQTKELEKVGFPKQLASIYHTLDPKVQQDLWKQVNLQNIGQQPQTEQAQQTSPVQPTFTPEQTEFIKSIPSPMDRQKVAQQFQQQNQQQMQQSPNQQFGQAAAQQQVAEKLAPKNPLSIFNSPDDKLGEKKTLANYKDQLKTQHEDKLHERKKIEESEKESKEWLKETNKKSRAVKEQNARLDKMEKLVHSGKLDLPATVGALTALEHGILGFGINLKGAILNSESQEFEKLSNDMLNGIQDVFGSRILKTEVDTFLKTIPNLLQSDEGKLKVINNLKILNEGKLAQDKVAKNIIKENGGKIPTDLQARVDERLDPILQDLHDKFVSQEIAQPKKSTYQRIFWE